MSDTSPAEGIAVVGMSGRFPGAADLDAYWRNVAQGVESIVRPSLEELAAAGVDAELLADPAYVRACPALEGIDRFDAAFFGVAAREAELMDPQHRVFLEQAFEALEDAGCDPARFDGLVGVFAGSTMSTYWNTRLLGHPLARRWPGSFQALLGNDKDYLAMYTSYKLGLRGPSIGVQTACSTSLVAVHLACMSLLDRECDAALCGGITIRVPHPSGYLSAEGSPFSPEGRCRPFDAAASGTVFGSGVGVLVLRRLEDALADGDPIRAVIRGSAINNDGAIKVGFTAPSEEGQARVVAEALALAGVEPRTIQYVEAHGTGTPLGDPIELAALRRVFARCEPGTCAIGSVKGNVGHLEAAAGMAGLIKTILALEHRELPPSINFSELNPAIELAGSPFVINTQRRPWSERGGPRRAGVSSFGIGGTNAHVVIEEVPAPRARGASSAAAAGSGPVLVPLSARSPEALRALVETWRGWLEGEPEWDRARLLDVAYTAAVRRSHHEHRMVVVADDRASLARALEEWLARGPVVEPQRRPSLVFVFPGSGTRWRGAGRELWQREAAFTAALTAADAALRRQGSASVLDVVVRPPADPAAAEPGVDVMQPALFALEVALAAQWRAWGVVPDAVVGHSLGEVAAAHVAGALSLDDAARVVVHRSRLLRRLEGSGAMVVVEQPASAVQERLTGALAIAALNGPRATVVAGPGSEVTALVGRYEIEGVRCRRVEVSIPFHTPLVDPLRAELRAALSGLVAGASAVPLWSTVTAAALPGEQLDASHWERNLREPVAFSPTIAGLARTGHGLFVEIGPHPSLLPHVDATLREASASAAMVVPTLRAGRERHTLSSSLAALHERGVPVAWSQVQPSEGRRCVALPRYPWQRRRFWVDPMPAARERRVDPKGHPLLGARMRLAASGSPACWESRLAADAPAFLGDHRVQGRVVLPGAACLELALAAVAELDGSGPMAVHDVVLSEALPLAADTVCRVQTVVEPVGLGHARFRVASLVEAPAAEEPQWRVHAAGIVRSLVAAPPAALELAAVQARCGQVLDGAAFYAAFAREGTSYGRAFQGVSQLWRGDDEALARVQAPEGLLDGAGAYRFHPALLDACMQVLAAAVPEARRRPALPVAVEALEVYAPAAAELWCHARLTGEVHGRLRGELVMTDRQGGLLARMRGLEVQTLVAAAEEAAAAPRYLVQRWQPAALDEAGHATSDAAGHWLVVSTATGAGSRVARELEQRGGSVELVVLGEHQRGVGEDAQRLGEGMPVGWPTRLRAAFPAGARARGVVLDVGTDATDEALDRLDVDLAWPFLVVEVTRALVELGMRQPPRLYLVTHGAQAIAPEDAASPLQASLWGLRRALAIEHPELRCTAIDLEPAAAREASAPQDDALALVSELLGGSREDEVGLRAGARWVARLRREPLAASAEVLVPAGERPHRLELDRRGTFDGLTLRAWARRPPGPREVELEVEAAGLNFIDVIKTMGLYPGLPEEPVPLGEELAGRVVRVGEGVTELRVGQAVLGLSSGSFGSHATTRVELVVPRPACLDAVAAATVPVAFLTAWYALYELARLRPGERVLVHSAAGGTGLAALQLARRVGARVLATAGTAEKRELLLRLGATHVFDSRAGTFAAEVMAATEGEGVDVVLNSLAGDAIEQGLSVLAEDGRFLELGKRDLYAPHRSLGMAAFRRRVSFHPVDLMGFAARHPERITALLRTITAALEAGELTPLPVRSVPLARVAELLQAMAQGRHVGKLAVTMGVPPLVAVAAGEATKVRADATYLVTGGLGGLGLVVARWLVEAGAGAVVLLGRKGVTSPSQAEALADMRERGAVVRVVEADVADRTAVARVLDDVAASGRPLRGIVHAAGVLEDGVFARLDRAALGRVMAPKALGAWNLHLATREPDAATRLDFMVLYASAVGVLGAPGQAAYAAANAFLDALAHRRRAQGLPTLAIDWGPFAEVGMAARSDVAARLGQHGMELLAPADGPPVAAELLAAGVAQAGVAPFDARRWLEFLPQLTASPRLSPLVEDARAPAPRPDPSLRSALEAAAPRSRAGILEAFVRARVATTLRIDAERIDRDAPLTSLGVDSLVGLELRNLLEAGTGLAFAGTLVWTYPTVAALAEHIGERLREVATPDTTVDDERVRGLQPPRDAGTAEGLAAEMDEAALLAMFDAKLEALEEQV